MTPGRTFENFYLQTIIFHLNDYTTTTTIRYYYTTLLLRLLATTTLHYYYCYSLLPHDYYYCYYYGVATISRLLKNIGLFFKRDLQKRPIFCKETYIFKHPTNRSHPIHYTTRYYYTTLPLLQTTSCHPNAGT